MLRLIVFLCVLTVALIMCGISSFKNEKTKLLSFMCVKGFAILSVFILSITASNLASNMEGTTLFILLALGLQVFSAIVKVLPTKNDMFEPLYKGLDMGSALCLAAAGLLIVPLSPIALPAGFFLGAVACAMYALFNRKFSWKVDLFKYLQTSFAAALLGQIIIILLASITIQTIVFSAGALIHFTYCLFDTFIKKDNISILITKNILFYISLLTFATSIFLIVY